MILCIDNYDSFVHNLARYLRRLGQTVVVVRNDAISADEIRALRPEAIVISPGPCWPRDAGCSLDVVKLLESEVPMLGVCLGHQVIAEALGGRVVRAAEPMHGRASDILHDGRDLFAELPNPLRAGRYHSLIVEEESLPASLEIAARTADGTIMAIRHRRRPLYGVQFHPESVLTTCGYGLLANFLRECGLPLPARLPEIDDERPSDTAAESPVWNVPVTF